MTTSYRWVILGVCTLGFMQTHIHRVGFAPLIPTFVADLRLTYTAAGVIMTAYFWTYTAAQVPIGLFVDRWGARRVMLIFMGCLAVGAVLFPSSQSYTQSLWSRALVGLGAAAVWVPSLRLISEWFRAEERGRVVGILSAGGGLGGTLALLLIPLAAERWGWRWGYRSTLLPVLLTLVLFALFLRGGDAPTTGRSEPGGGAGGSAGALRRVLGTPVIWWFNVSVLLFYGAYFSMITWLPAFLVGALRVSPAQAGFVTSLVTAGTIVSWPLAGFISDRLGRRKGIYLFSQLMNVLILLVFALAGPHLSFLGAAAVALAAGLLFGGFINPFVMVVELFPRELAGTASGVVNTFCFVGSLTIPVALGRVVDLTGSFPAAFLAAAALQALAFVAACFTRETGGRGAPA